MNTISWLHLSDLHFRAAEQHKWDEDIVLRLLLEDVRKCTKEQELALDLILISGDIAFGGTSPEYDLAREFFDSLLEVTGLPKDRMFVVPGNHDVDRDRISSGATTHAQSLDSEEAIRKALSDDWDRKGLLRRLKGYCHFVNEYFGDHIPFDYTHYFYTRHLELGGFRVEVLGLNSAWLAHGGHKERGYLALGEQQVRQALEAGRNDANLRIALLHHPFEWLHDFDGKQCEALLMSKCDFILNGHLHYPELVSKETPDSRVITITAGACYDTRKHRNSYNLVQIDMEDRKGTVFLRAWSNQGSGHWVKDVETYKAAEEGEFPFWLDEYPQYGQPRKSLRSGLWIKDEQTYKDAQDGKLTVSLDEYLYAVPPGGDSLQTIESQFSRYTDRVLSLIRLSIPGMTDSFSREEVTWIGDQLRQRQPVILTGDAGTGKSGIGASLINLARDSSDRVVLLLDARRVGHIRSKVELQQNFALNGPIDDAIEHAGRYKGCLLVIDQVDNVVGFTAAAVLVDLAIDCSKFEGVEVVVISRKREAHEGRLLDKLTNAGFVELTSHPLSESKAEDALKQLGIPQYSPELVVLSRNLLNLELIGNIKQKQPGFNISAVMDEVDLWNSMYRSC